jgi:glutamate/tyrosine decarboxylase-like PLP-dependent enzyme
MRLAKYVSTYHSAQGGRRAAESIITVKDRPSIWLHVDAAWAGVTLACPEYRDIAQLGNINKYADSFCTNFHKVRLLGSIDSLHF